jgi:GrpB-like predicted nucleotidyltransferase (UPF0157 family)
MLGLKKGFVELFPHNEIWHQLFEQEKAQIQELIGGCVLAIEHVGSTSICGISAKPILDIAIAVRKFTDGKLCVGPLENYDYEYRGEQGISRRHYFVKGEPRTHHIHMVELESDFWKGHLIFRDYLRQNPRIALEYDRLKKRLARKYGRKRDAYLEGKANFIENVLCVSGFVANT